MDWSLIEQKLESLRRSIQRVKGQEWNIRYGGEQKMVLEAVLWEKYAVIALSTVGEPLLDDE